MNLQQAFDDNLVAVGMIVGLRKFYLSLGLKICKVIEVRKNYIVVLSQIDFTESTIFTQAKFGPACTGCGWSMKSFEIKDNENEKVNS